MFPLGLESDLNSLNAMIWPRLVNVGFRLVCGKLDAMLNENERLLEVRPLIWRGYLPNHHSPWLYIQNRASTVQQSL